MAKEGVVNETINRAGSHSVKWESTQQKFGTQDLLPLWVADMDIACAKCVQEALLNRALHPIYGYTIYPKRYFDAIIYWMQNSFGYKIDKEMIVPGFGVVPAICTAIDALSSAGDGIIVQTPIYPPFISSIKHLNRKVLDNALLYKKGCYEIDFEDLETKAKKAKLLLLCSPHNPTSRAWQRWELERVAAICRRHNVVIISDEIHSDIVYERVHIPIARIAPDITVTLNAPSKSFNVAGLNTSYAIIANSTLRRKYAQRQRKSGYSNGNIFGIEALIAAYSQGQEWLESTKAYLKGNIEFVKEFLEAHNLPIRATATEATFLMWLECKDMQMSDKALAEFFIKRAKLGLNCGIDFGSGGSGFMRLNIATSKELLEIAMRQLFEALKEL